MEIIVCMSSQQCCEDEKYLKNIRQYLHVYLAEQCAD